MFKHALTQDVAYDSLLVQRRRELHASWARAIEELYADRLARALRDARPPLLEGGGLAARAGLSPQGRREGHRRPSACARRWPTTARLWWRRAGWRIGCPPPTLIAIHRARADLFFGLGEFVRSREEAEQPRRPRAACPGSSRGGGRARASGHRVPVDRGLPGGPRARAGGHRDRGDGGGAGAAGRRSLHPRLSERGQWPARRGGGRPRRAPCRSGGPWATPIARHSCCTSCRSGAAGRGSIARAWRSASEGIRLAREHRLVIPLLRCLWNQGLACHEMGEYDRALATLVEGLDAGREARRRRLRPALSQYARVPPTRLRRLRRGHRAVRAVRTR